MDRIVATGGLASSAFVVQTFADAVRRPIALSPAKEAVACGAAVCGALAAQRFGSASEAVSQMCGEQVHEAAPQD